MKLEFLFKQFVNEKRYVTKASHNTVLFYETIFPGLQSTRPTNQEST